MQYPAHIYVDSEGMHIQTAETHCRNTATYASSCLCSIGLSHAAKLAGLVHDCGKFKDEFEQYIRRNNAVRGSVNHTFAGVRLLLEHYHGNLQDPTRSLSAELLALAVGGHHGLFDCLNGAGVWGLAHRLGKPGIGFDESKENFLEQCASKQELDCLFEAAHAELSRIYAALTELTMEQEELDFHLGLLARLLLSAVIEGDRRDTAQFMGGITYSPVFVREASFWIPYLERVEKKLATFSHDTSMGKARGEISNRCRIFAEREGGIYRLNVPTGAGKTLSSLRYSLAHAKKWNKSKVIFVSPLLSILEQNAAVIREYLEDDSIILEHHSNVIQAEGHGALDLRELAMESWNKPVIITTLVQLLNTLFAGQTTAIRRMQGLCNSIIVIDEVQTVPLKMGSLFNLAMDFLAKVCGATIILCSATQPCMEQAPHPMRLCIKDGDMVPYDKALWEPFKRTEITDRGGKTLDEIEALARASLKEVSSLLVVCNKKAEAEYLFNHLKDDAPVSFHLSSSMCVAHRRNVLKELREGLELGKKCLCVATQVIEAGVDISFSRVIRLSAGMDSVVQAAGRCNRHGEQQGLAQVLIVDCLGEALGMLREIQEGKEATISLLGEYNRNPAQFDCDLSSDKAIKRYYRKLYSNMRQKYQDFYVESEDVTLFDLLGCNEKYSKAAKDLTRFSMRQAFKQAGAIFRVFDENTRDLLVPYGSGRELINELTSVPPAAISPAFLAAWEKRARAYTISVYDWQLQVLGNAVTEYEGVAFLNPDYYDQNTGLCLKPQECAF